MSSSTNLMINLLVLLALASLLSPAPALCYIHAGEAGSVVRTPNGTPPPPADAYRTYIVLVDPPPHGAATDDDGHRRWHESFLPGGRRMDDGADQARIIRSYTEVFEGFAARLTAAELAGVVSKKPGFVRAFPGRRTLRLMTTHTPEFLGLTRGAGFWRDVAGYGKGVVVGLLDTGVHAAHPSFDDRGVPPPPARWRGSCAVAATRRCNNKLVGVKSFVDGGGGGDDDVGHGTHTASTAAGNFVAGGASDRGLGAGTAAGIAPGAHVAMYKVCNGSGCDDDAVLAGFDEAMKDGVDVLSVSLGRWSSPPFDEDPIAIAAFSAVARGITVVCAAGNGGPEPSTVSNDAPWLLTVAAGSVDRSFSTTVLLGNGELVAGQALAQQPNSSTSYYPLLFSEKQPKCNELAGIVGDGVAGHLVVCQSDPVEDESVVSAMMATGAGGVVLINTESEGYTTVLEDYGPGMVQVTVAGGHNITEYARSSSSSAGGCKPNATVVFDNTLLSVHPAPTVASFSSRGPSKVAPGVLKPDVLAPGLNILAAWPPHLQHGGGGGGGGLFKVISGTSMATPHASGVAALVKSRHPDWSPAAIKSAILTTSDAVDGAGNPILDEHHERATAFLTGAGHINPARAADPGLVYDIAVADYAGYICALLGDAGLGTIVRNESLSCGKLDKNKIPEAQLNYPTITVPLPRSSSSAAPPPFTVNRTVTNVGPARSTYTVKLEIPRSLTMRVSPEKLVFSGVGEKKDFSVTVSGGGGGGGEVVEGSLSWVSGKHVVRSPIVAVPQPYLKLGS
uniref:Subtilisin-like protease n=1 Tax=Oryza glumipatula TaxID=40148 RepID=A0A0D9Z981_9ORYZ